MFDKKTIRDTNYQGKHVLVRVDFNVPLADGKVADDTRIQAALPTIKYLLNQGAALILCSHLGRPKGKFLPSLSLRPVAKYLDDLVKSKVYFVDNSIGSDVETAAHNLQPGEILVLENTRFHKGEKNNNPEYARQLAALAVSYVNDAFGTAHRAHASNVGVTKYLPSVAGLLLEKEIKFLGKAISRPKRPFIAILGGAKVSDKIDVIRNLIGKADKILIGGGMANTFFKAQGFATGDSLVEMDSIETARELLVEGRDLLSLPVDVVIGDKFDANARQQVMSMGAIPEGWRILDIGPVTISNYSRIIEDAGMVIWNGPMGVFEFSQFARGTFELAAAMAKSNALSIIGGGDSAAAIQQSGLAKQVDHISTGGGASLQMLEGRALPGVDALENK
ncbi:MAG: phosphoglycerate kinase [Anaerolineae bacterium]|nr:phosphoglycerate kinase [Anaerolineae bacterium]